MSSQNALWHLRYFNLTQTEGFMSKAIFLRQFSQASFGFMVLFFLLALNQAHACSSNGVSRVYYQGNGSDFSVSFENSGASSEESSVNSSNCSKAEVIYQLNILKKI